jgi:hypothetical protein
MKSRSSARTITDELPVICNGPYEIVTENGEQVGGASVAPGNGEMVLCLLVAFIAR